MLTPRHPAVQAILAKLKAGQMLTDDEVLVLKRQMVELEMVSTARRRISSSETHDSFPEWTDKISGHANSNSFDQYARRFGNGHSASYRTAQGLVLSSIGVGTHLGPVNFAVDQQYVDAIHQALVSGINVIDTAINYRMGRSEYVVGAALRRFIKSSGGSRSQVLICTKGGYLTPVDLAGGEIGSEAIGDGIHSLHPKVISTQIRRSKTKMGVDAIDVYYVHNPDAQLRNGKGSSFERQLADAFETLEAAVERGDIRYYGVATWDGFDSGHLSLLEMYRIALVVGGTDNKFRFLQFPLNLGLQSALRRPAAHHKSLLETAQELGFAVITSASLMQGRLCRDLPADQQSHLNPLSDAQRAVQFARSASGVKSALVGLRKVSHALEMAQLLEYAPISVRENGTENNEW